MFDNKYPYTDFHELNLDWFMGEFKKLVAEWEETKGEWNTLHDYVQNYFDNLNIQTEIDNKINAMILDGTFADIISPFVTAALPALVAGQLPDVVAAQISSVVAAQISAVVAAQLPAVAAAAAAQEVSTWLAAHIDPDTGYVIDKTLTVSDAAADAKVTGDKLQSEEKILQYYKTSLTLLEGYYYIDNGQFISNSNFRSTEKMLYYGVPNFSVNPQNCNVWYGNTYLGRYAYADFDDIPSHDTISFTWTSAAAADGITMTPEGDVYAAITDIESDITDIESDIDNILTNGVVSPDWEQGGYNVGYGSALASDKRIRIVGKITEFASITSDAGYEFALFIWDDNTYQGCYSENGFDTENLNTFTSLTFDDVESLVSGLTLPKYAVVGKNTENTDILPTEGSNFHIYKGDHIYAYDEMQQIIYDNIENIDPLSGKSLVVDGSSIMYGAGYTGGWAKILQDEYGMNVTNRAVNGATIAIVDGGYHALATSIDTTPISDYFVFDTMRNDYTNNVPFGTPSDSDDYNPTLDKTTFCGAFEYVCKKLATDYGTEKIGYLFDHRRPPLDDVFVNTWEPYAIATLKKWGIPYLNLEELDPPIGFVPELYNNYTHNNDKVHPNEQGYRIFYVPKIVAWLKTL